MGNAKNINTKTFRILFDKKAQQLKSVYNGKDDNGKNIQLTGSKRKIVNINDWIVDTRAFSISEL